MLFGMAKISHPKTLKKKVEIFESVDIIDNKITRTVLGIGYLTLIAG